MTLKFHLDKVRMPSSYKCIVKLCNVNLLSALNGFHLWKVLYYSSYFSIVPLFSAPEAVLSAVGNMSSKPQDTLCLPPRRQEGEPGPPSKSNSLEQERYRMSTLWENYLESFLNTESVPIQDIWHRKSA